MTREPEISKRGRPAGSDRDPWSVPVLVAQIPATGLHKVIEPTHAEAAALAAAAGITAAKIIRAEFTLTPARGDRIRVEGRVTGRVEQVCVVTLEPLENGVDETVELTFAPAAEVQALAASKSDGGDDEAERPDPPEPIENGVIDLGRIASDALFLGLDPYPRKPDAVFATPTIEDDPDDHPFAALKALKPNS